MPGRHSAWNSFRWWKIQTPKSFSRNPLGFEQLDDRNLLSVDLSLSIAAASEAARGEQVQYTFQATGVSEPGYLVYAIDWNGDSIHETIQIGGSELTFNRPYDTLGFNVVHAFIFDPNSGQVAEAATATNIVAWRLAPNATDPTKIDLIVGGSNTADDFIVLYPGTAFVPEATPDTVVFLNSTDPAGLQVALGVTGVIHVYGQGGNDTIMADLTLEGLPPLIHSVRIDGGAGDDFILGTSNADLLLGGDGNDVIHGGITLTDLGDYIDGGAGRDILYGGKGSDYVIGGTGEDILTGGISNTSQETWTGLQARGHWLSTTRPDAPFWVRVADTGRYFSLRPEAPGIKDVLDDEQVDILIGGTDDLDWFLRSWNQDILIDSSNNEHIVGW